MRRTEEVGEAGGGGDGGEEEEGAGCLPWWEAGEEAAHPKFLVWKEAVEEEWRQGLWMEEGGEEGLHGPLWMGEVGEVELSCGAAEEAEGDHHEREEEGELKEKDDRHHELKPSHKLQQLLESMKFQLCQKTSPALQIRAADCHPNFETG